MLIRCCSSLKSILRLFGMDLERRKGFVLLFQGDGTSTENKYIEALEKEGISAKTVPVLSFNFINFEKLQRCLLNSECYNGIIFTSTRAVSAISSSLTSLPQDMYLEQWKKKMNFSVGKATSDYAFSTLNLSTYGSDSGNSENLANFIIEKCGFSNKPLLFPCSNIRKDTIPTALSEKGIPIEELICYETVPNKDFECSWKTLVSEEGLPDVLIFFSPSGVETCIDVVKSTYSVLGLPKFIAIGPSTGKALLDTNIPCKVASKPTPEAIVFLVMDVLNFHE